MSNYKETAVAGQSWVRAVRVVIENPYGGGTPAVTFQEEQVVVLGDDVMVRPHGSVIEPFTLDNAMETFDLLHPETGTVIGEMTYQQVYVALHSLYLHIAAKRDAEAVVVA